MVCSKVFRINNLLATPGVRSFEKVNFSPSGTIVSFANKEKKPVGPDIFSKAWLQQEVAKERQKLIPEGQTPWYYLPGTGFWVKEQIARLMRNGNLADVGEDTRAFEREYLKQMVSLRWNLAIGEENGKKRIVCTDAFMIMLL